MERREKEMNERRKELLTGDEDNYFGHCKFPEHEMINRNVKDRNGFGKTHIMCCDECKICWCIGHNLFSGWRYETEEDWNRNYEIIKNYEYLG